MRRGSPTPFTRSLLVFMVIVVLGAGSAGCVCTAGWCATFRDVANPLFQSGATSIVTGIIDGIFALLEPQDDSASANADFSMSSDPTTP